MHWYVCHTTIYIVLIHIHCKLWPDNQEVHQRPLNLERNELLLKWFMVRYCGLHETKKKAEPKLYLSTGERLQSAFQFRVREPCSHSKLVQVKLRNAIEEQQDDCLVKGHLQLLDLVVWKRGLQSAWRQGAEPSKLPTRVLGQVELLEDSLTPAQQWLLRCIKQGCIVWCSWFGFTWIYPLDWTYK